MAIAALAHRQFFSYKDFSEHFNGVCVESSPSPALKRTLA
jgi:hypothetical protein